MLLYAQLPVRCVLVSVLPRRTSIRRNWTQKQRFFRQTRHILQSRQPSGWSLWRTSTSLSRYE